MVDVTSESALTGYMPPTRALGAFLRTGACSRALLETLDRTFADRLPEEERASVPLAGGILQRGHQCGMVWGSTLAAGARAYRLFGPGPRAQAKALAAAQRIVRSFGTRYQSIDCFDVFGVDWKTASGRQIARQFLALRCFRMSVRYPPVAVHEIDTAFSEEADESLPAPGNCCALLAQKMVASDLHAVMVAGLAGGIGLSGRACGALGAAVWLAGIKTLKAGNKISYQEFPAGEEMVRRFVDCTGGEFQCARIVGRVFENVGDHAAYVCGGGCAKIIEALAGDAAPQSGAGSTGAGERGLS